MQFYELLMSSLRLLRHNCPHLKGPKYDLKIYVDDAVIQCTYMYTSYAYLRLWVNSSGFCIMSSPGLGIPGQAQVCPGIKEICSTVSNTGLLLTSQLGLTSSKARCVGLTLCLAMYLLYRLLFCSSTVGRKLNKK